MMFPITLHFSNIVWFNFNLLRGGGEEKHDKASFYFGDGSIFRLHFNFRECPHVPKNGSI
jgi:hypothetical protein